MTLRLLVRLEKGLPPEELARDCFTWSFVARSMGMGAQVTDRRHEPGPDPGAWFRVLYTGEDKAHPGEYDLYVPRRAIGSARIVRVAGLPVLCGHDEPRYIHDGKTLGFDAVSSIFHLLSAREEYRPESRDELGRLDEASSFLHRNGLVEQPLANLYLRVLEERITEKTGSGPFTERWPGGKPFALALSHDVDTLNDLGLSALRNCIIRAAGERTLSRKIFMACAAARRTALFPLGLSRSLLGAGDSDGGIDLICRLEERLGVRSTFFVFSPRPVPAHPLDGAYSYGEKVRFQKRRYPLRQVLGKLADGGWEIGLHGSIRSSARTPILKAQKEGLEEVLGGSVRSVRQHYLCFENDGSWLAQESAGFCHDSTHGYNGFAGFRSSCCLPFRPFSLSRMRELDVWETPLTVQDSATERGEWRDGEAYRRATTLLSRVRDTGGAATLSWHSDRFAKPFFRPQAALYERLITWAQQENAFIGSLEQVMKAWKERADSVVVDFMLDRDFSSGVSTWTST